MSQTVIKVKQERVSTSESSSLLFLFSDLSGPYDLVPEIDRSSRVPPPEEDLELKLRFRQNVGLVSVRLGGRLPQ